MNPRQIQKLYVKEEKDALMYNSVLFYSNLLLNLTLKFFETNVALNENVIICVYDRTIPRVI